MAANADSVVVELIAQNAQFDAAAKSSAATFSQSMKEIERSGSGAEAAHGRLSASVGNSRIAMMEFQHVARGASDQIAAGTPLTQILTQHLGQLSQATSLAGGTFGKFGAFLGGPWGIALTLATTIVAKLALGHSDASDSAEKHRTAEETLTAYIHGEAIATDALVDSLMKLNDQRSKGLQSTNDQIRAEQDLALATLHTAESNRAVLATQLASAQAAAAAPNIITPGGTASASGGDARAQVIAIQQQLDEVDRTISHATALIATDFTTLARNLSTHVGRANDEFDKQLAALEAKYRGTATTGPNAKGHVTTTLHGGLFNQQGANTAALQQQLIAAEEKLGATRARAVAAAQKLDDAEKGVVDRTHKLTGEITAFSLPVKGTVTGRYGDQRPGHVHAGVDIAVPVGTQVHAPAGGTVIEAGSLPGYGNVVFIDHGGGTISRLAHLSQISVARGQQIGQGAIVGLSGGAKGAAGAGDSTGPHVHYEVRVGGRAVNPLTGRFNTDQAGSEAHAQDAAVKAAEKAAREAEQAAQKKAQQDALFLSAMDGLNAELISASKAQVKGELEQLDIQQAEVLAEEKKRDDGYQSAVTLGRLTQVQANQLIAAEATVAGEKLKAIELQKQVSLVKDQDDAAERTAQYQQDNLRAVEQGATSQAQRREIDLQILDILYQEKEAHLKRLKLIAEDNHDQKGANDLQAQIDQLPQQKANDVQSTLRGTMDPLHSWLQSVPHDAQAVTAALQGIATNGFDNLASSISGVITGTESLGHAFGNLAKQVITDLVQMTIKMLIFRALSSVLGGGGLGQSIYPVANGVDPLAALPARASGGPVSSNQAYLVGENGPEVFVPGSSGSIIPNNASAASPWASGGQSVVVVHVEANDYFDARVAQVSGPIAAQAGMRGAFGGAALARNGLARRQMHQLGSRG